MGMAGADEPSDANGAGPTALGSNGTVHLPPTVQRAAIAAARTSAGWAPETP